MKKLPIAFYLVVCSMVVIIVFAVSISLRATQRNNDDTGMTGEDDIHGSSSVCLNEVLTNEMSWFDGQDDIDRIVERFLGEWKIKGASLAIMRNDSLLFAKGYGYANEEVGEKMKPSNILRMASVSKLITATGIMILCEEGAISLKDTVFGPSGILNDSLYTASINEKAKYEITVEHLLRHQGGFTDDFGDPMFSTCKVMRRFHLNEVPDSHTLVQCILKDPLGYEPGTDQSYSNFGYLLLSLIIEKISGSDYETFIRDNVLEPAGCHDIHIAKNYYEERWPNEVRYYLHEEESEKVEEYNLSGRMVERCYGGNNISGLSGAGAWCGSPAELCRFVASIDGRSEIGDIISEASVVSMTEYYGPDIYSLGWNDTKPDEGWKRTGTLGGTSALIKYYPDGECWIMITNTSTWRGAGFTSNIGQMFDACRESCSSVLPARNLFNFPA